MTPPSTLRLSGIAATVVALVLMGANRTDHRVVRHEAPEARFVYAFGELAEARAKLAEARTMEYAEQIELARRMGMAADSVARAARPAPAPKVRMWHPHQPPPATPGSPESPAAGR
jgi:hypothetical protein